MTDGARSGFEYLFRQLLITPEQGAVIAKPDRHLVLTVPLHRCPLPADFLGAYEDARDLALRSVDTDFEAMSVALARPSGAPRWCFRFYDFEDIVTTIYTTDDGMQILDYQRRPKPITAEISTPTIDPRIGYAGSGKAVGPALGSLRIRRPVQPFFTLPPAP